MSATTTVDGTLPDVLVVGQVRRVSVEMGGMLVLVETRRIDVASETRLWWDRSTELAVRPKRALLDLELLL